MRTELGPYRVDSVIGEGAMGIVYRAHDAGGAAVALKVLRPELADDAVYRRRFEREGRIAGELRHRHLASVLEVGEDGGVPYLAARYVEGESLAERLERGRLSPGELVRLAAEIGSALDALHERGLVHRDVKPANVIVEPDGTAVLTDFGLARGEADTVLTTPGRLSGTIDYVAPELIRGSPATPASDVYALGCLTYECLAGAPPFGDRPVAEAALAHLEAEPRPLPSPLSFAVLQALAKEPALRPPTASAYALMLAVSAR
jgi:serine/threonine-protein kinase